MIRSLAALLALTIATSGSLAAAPPPPADLAGRVSVLLGGFPADTPRERDGLCEEILRLGPGGIAEVCARVLPPEVGDDSRARFAVNGLAVYVTRPGAESERAVFAQALLGALATAKDPTVAAFFLSQVQLAGKKESVRPLEKYLRDEKLAGPAAAALLTIGGPEATRALLKALDAATPAARLTLVQSLGEARSREAVKKIVPLAESGDEPLRRAARFALANIGDPAAGPVLAKSRVTGSYRERQEAPSLYLLYARRLVESGRTAEGLEAARAILESYRGPEESQHASEALALVVSALGPRALPDLLAAAASPDRRFRGSALALAERIPGREATLAWVEKAASAPPDVRADLVAMLGQRGDAAALPLVLESLRSPDESVRLAAIPAAARLGGEAVLPDLLPLLGSAGSKEAAALKTALLGYPAKRVVPEAVRLVDSTPVPARAVLVEVLGEKGARGEVDRMFRLAEDEDPAIRGAALSALGKLAGDAELPRLVPMLQVATDANDVARLQEAVAAAARRNPDEERRGEALVELLRAAAPAGKVAIVKVLPRVGGAKALQAAVEQAGSPDADVQSAAVESLSRWPDPAAADALMKIASSTQNREHFRSAVQGYVRIVGRSDAPAGKKLASYRTLLALPGEGADRRAVLAGIGNVREPESLHLLAGYLDNPELREAAASALLNLASRQSPEERWLSGHEAYSVLRRVQAMQADAVGRERVGKLIAERLKQGGFVPLFDGRSLDGWKGLVADPPARAKMTPAELASAQAAADEKMRAHWKVEDGVLVFDGNGESLCTKRDYADFELLADWKIEKNGDSGLYLRGSPQVQIWDPDANPVGSGGLFNNEKGPSKPTEKADRPVGEWNSFRVVMIGDRVTVYLNDRRVVEDAVLENYWERDKPIYPAGQIELQAHGNPLWFRNLYVREIPRDASVPTITEAEKAEGFVPLFNGRDLEGWTGAAASYVVEGGKVVVHPERGGGNLYTQKEYGDFVIRFDFKLAPAANNGLGVRAPLEGDAAYVGMELQILEDGSPVYWNLHPYQYHGSVYGIVPAKRGVQKPVGEWNSEEATVEGRRVSVVVNGITIVDADLDDASAGGTMDGKEHPGLKRPTGHIGFLGHGSRLELRNIRVKELGRGAMAEASPGSGRRDEPRAHGSAAGSFAREAPPPSRTIRAK
jgi:HEAT repeat protein